PARRQGRIRRKVRSWQQAPAIYRGQLVAGFALPFATDCLTGNFIEVVIVIFTGAANEHVLFFPDHVLTHVLRHFEVRGQLDGVGRTRFFTETAHDAAREVDAEKFRVPTAVLVFGFLQRDAVYR